jgi:putative oxidoreductase
MKRAIDAVPGLGWFVRFYLQTVRLIERVSYDTLVATPARVYLATVFWLSGRTKVDEDFNLKGTTYYLFMNEFNVPLLPPVWAAYITTYAEHIFPILLVLGLASRFSAGALLVMTIVIQIFVFPGAWATHLMWASAALFIIFRGPGALALDYPIRRWAEAKYTPAPDSAAR